MNWLMRLLGTASAPTSPASVTTFPSGLEHDARMLEQTRRALSDSNIARALSKTEIAPPSDANIRMIRDALWDQIFPTGLALRKAGRKMSREELNARGMRGNTICSIEVYEALSNQAKADPVAATQSLVTAIMGWQAGHDRISGAAAAAGQDAKIIVYPNKMAAGPCPACIRLGSKPQPLSAAPNGPLASCPHPDQCNLLWRTLSEFEDFRPG